VLLLTRDLDRLATKESYEYAADLTPDCALKMDEGTDHR
jgi:hypothetical protein